MIFRPCFTILCTILFLKFISTPDLHAQQTPFQITTDQDSRGGIQFYATTNTYVPLILTIDFTTLTNLDVSVALPHSSNLTGSRTRLLTLKRQWEDQRINYRYRTRYHTGCLNTNPKEIEYLLPYPEESSARAGQVSYLGQMLGQDAPESWYALSFHPSDQTEITAARKGTVIAVRDGENSPSASLVYTSDRNFVILAHDDCTFVRYTTFQDNEIYVREGDIVQAGEPIGKMAGDEYQFGNQIRMLIYYRNNESVTMDPRDAEGVHPWHYVKPQFRTTDGEFTELNVGTEYISIHPEEIITSEMSRRERRQWRRDH